MTPADDSIRPAQRADLAARIARAEEFRDGNPPPKSRAERQRRGSTTTIRRRRP